MSYGRRSFLKHSAMFTGLLATDRLFPHARRVFAAPPPNRPLQFLVLGDSVNWGQGLNDDQKFYALVQQWLKQQLFGRDVNVTVMAHSGATVLPLEESAPGCDGEVNISWPTINVQMLDAAAKYRREGIDPRMIDLVLVNGGINDVGPGNLVNPFFSAQKIRDKAQQACGANMKNLLSDIADTFCNARIIVTGYFPIISTATPPDMFIKLIFALAGVPKVGRVVLTEIFELVRAGILLGQQKAGPLLTLSAHQSDVWYVESTLALQNAVKDVNAKLAASSRRNGCDITMTNNPLDRRIAYAHAVFKREHCFATGGSSLLWTLKDNPEHVGLLHSPIDRLISEDGLFEKRQQLCTCPDAGFSEVKQKICERAGTAHPNINGAKEYARAIQAQLETLLPFTGWTGPHAEALTLNIQPAAAAMMTEGAVVPASATAAPLSPVPRGIDHPFFVQAKNHPEVIAHRGGAGEWPGETVVAYQHAVDAGVDVLEMDVYLTKDDELVLMHNPTVNGTTNGKGLIAGKTVSELKDLDAGYKWSDDGNRTFRYRGQGITVPTLKEIFETFPNMRMNIEMKPATKSPVDRLSRLIAEHEMTDRVLVASFVQEYLREFREASPRVATSASATKLLKFFLLNNSFVNGSFTPDADAFQIWETIVPQQFARARRFVDRIHRLNVPVHAWTVNDPVEMQRLIALDVDGIITDYPTRLLEERRKA